MWVWNPVKALGNLTRVVQRKALQERDWKPVKVQLFPSSKDLNPHSSLVTVDPISRDNIGQWLARDNIRQWLVCLTHILWKACQSWVWNPIKASCCFIEQETLSSLLSTGWFQEQNRAWLNKQDCFFSNWIKQKSIKTKVLTSSQPILCSNSC